MKTVYLDYAAATPLDSRVLKQMAPFWTDKFHNPSASYQAAGEAREAVETARGEIAHILGVKSTEIIMTSGGTEANNLAIRGVMEAHPKSKMLISAIEHDSVRRPAELYDAEVVSVDAGGIVDIDDLRKKLDETVVLVSIMHANNEIGTVQSLRKIAQVLDSERIKRKQKGIKTPLYLHSDACQSANYLDIHAHTLGVDLLTINGGKIYGPKQSGCLFVAANVDLSPQILGGGQQRALRSGTESPAQVVGLAAALEIAVSMKADEVKRLQNLQKYLIKQLEAKFPAISINGSKKYRLPNNVSITIPGQSNERLLIQLEDHGIQAAAGSACKAASKESSSVLQALGLNREQADSSIRLTFGRTTTQKDLDTFLDALTKVLA